MVNCNDNAKRNGGDSTLRSIERIVVYTILTSKTKIVIRSTYRYCNTTTTTITIIMNKRMHDRYNREEIFEVSCKASQLSDDAGSKEPIML